MSENSDKLFCLCRSSDVKGFMIQCEICDEWFHGDCVHVTRKDAKKIEHYYCDPCIGADPSINIVYKTEKPKPEKRPVPVKQEPLEERKQEKKVTDNKNVSTTSTIPKKAKIKVARQPTQTKADQNNKRKAKSKSALNDSKQKKQCLNPECIYEARQNSQYCSPDCGYTFNKLRYETHFIPRWQNLAKNHSQARLKKMKDLDQLEKDKVDVEQLIKNLRLEKEEMERTIKIIKEDASKLYKENENSRKENDDDDVDMGTEDVEMTTGDLSKTYCITCGCSLAAENPFKHWQSCHKKHEDLYNFTADAIFKLSCKEDEDPKLYCHVQDKKTKRFCMNYESACPQHTNWLSDKDEVCGCPLNIMQKLVPDGNYCLELKKDCNQHYHWDKFRLAQLNMQRIQAFTRLDHVIDRIDKTSKSLDDTYGGVIGVMLHNTVNHTTEKVATNNGSQSNYLNNWV